MNNKTSFLSDLLHSLFGSIYQDFYDAKGLIVIVGTCIFTIIFGLSHILYSSIINYFLPFVTGFSLTFIVYVIAWWMLLDIKVETREEEYVYSKKGTEKSKAYKFTIVWGTALVILGISAMYYTNKYRKHYAHLCETFVVDCNTKVYHLEDSDCEELQDVDGLIEMKGYEIKKGYTFCEECKEYKEEMEGMVYERR